jgi:Tol biopolymer transport system component/Skp family chaperone for outer membrane proteins
MQNERRNLMKKRSIMIAILVVVAFSFGNLAAQNGYDLFQKALAKERGEGNLEEAIALYQKVIEESKDESLAAKAQLRIGICYEKLGLNKAKLAQDAFQKVISDYPGQKDIVRMAQEKLSNLVQAQTLVEQGDRGKNLRLVWEGPDVEVLGEASPDGRYISYTDWNTGNIAVYETSTKKKWPLTGNKTSDGSFPINSRWCPDGKKVAYDWYTRDGKGELRLIGLDGSEPQTLVDSYLEIIVSDWSPDGKYILALTFPERNASFVSLVSVADGSVKTIKKRKWKDSNMRFSPDGKYIVFNHQSEKQVDCNIHVISIDGKNEIPLVEHPANDYFLGWMENGKYLLFASDRTGTFDAWLLPVADGKPQGEPRIVQKNIGYVTPMGVTRNGAFYYASSSSIQNIYFATVNPETCLSDAPTEKMNWPFEGRNHTPEFSPDGRQIAFVRSSLPQPSINFLQAPNFLCIRSLEDGTEKTFPLNHHVWDLRWSPDSSSIMIEGRPQESSAARGRPIINLNSGEVTRQVPTRRPAASPEWSSDGTGIFYLQYGKPDCFVVYQDLKTGQTKELHQIDRKTRPNLTISPDGKWLAVIEQPSKTPSGKSERLIRIIPSEGGESRVLCRFETESNHMVRPRWSADGRFVLYPNLQSGEEFWEWWRAPVNGGQPQKMGIPVTRAYTVSPHPNGRQIAFTSQGPNKRHAGIWVMENFLPGKNKGEEDK